MSEPLLRSAHRRSQWRRLSADFSDPVSMKGERVSRVSPLHPGGTTQRTQDEFSLRVLFALRMLRPGWPWCPWWRKATLFSVALVGGCHHSQVLYDFLCVLCLSGSRLTSERHECGDSHGHPCHSPSEETKTPPSRGIYWICAGAHMEARGQPLLPCTFKKEKNKNQISLWLELTD